MGKTMLVHSTKPETDLWTHIIHSPPVFLNMACWKIPSFSSMICPAFRSIHDEDFPETHRPAYPRMQGFRNTLSEKCHGASLSASPKILSTENRNLLASCSKTAIQLIQWPNGLVILGRFIPFNFIMLMMKVRYICGRYGNMLNAWCGTSTLLDAGINGG